jgi:transposase InsO family protein
MALADYLVAAVLIEGRPVAEVAADHGVSRSWLYELLARYREHGDAGLRPRSRRPHRSPTRTAAAVEDEIVRWRKRLVDQGLDAGAATIHTHLLRAGGTVPSQATIWRILARRGFIAPQPAKRPRSSYTRFEADLDDHSRLLLASHAATVFDGTKVLATFNKATHTHGEPASLLTDNGCVFTAKAVGGQNALETHLAARGITAVHSRPYHPQTCGKVERVHQTLKNWLATQPKATSLATLQTQLDRFRRLYNQTRPHRALGRHTPAEAFKARIKAQPTSPAKPPSQLRLRRDTVDLDGKLTIRYAGQIRHLGIGRRYAGTRVRMLINDRDIRVLNLAGQLLGNYTINPDRNYQARNTTEPCPGCPATGVRDVLRDHTSGAEGIRTPGLLVANETRYQLRHSPRSAQFSRPVSAA